MSVFFQVFSHPELSDSSKLLFILICVGPGNGRSEEELRETLGWKKDKLKKSVKELENSKLIVTHIEKTKGLFGQKILIASES